MKTFRIQGKLFDGKDFSKDSDIYFYINRISNFKGVCCHFFIKLTVFVKRNGINTI